MTPGTFYDDLILVAHEKGLFTNMYRFHWCWLYDFFRVYNMWEYLSSTIKVIIPIVKDKGEKK